MQPPPGHAFLEPDSVDPLDEQNGITIAHPHRGSPLSVSHVLVILPISIPERKRCCCERCAVSFVFTEPVWLSHVELVSDLRHMDDIRLPRAVRLVKNGLVDQVDTVPLLWSVGKAGDSELTSSIKIVAGEEAADVPDLTLPAVQGGPVRCQSLEITLSNNVDFVVFPSSLFRLQQVHLFGYSADALTDACQLVHSQLEETSAVIQSADLLRAAQDDVVVLTTNGTHPSMQMLLSLPVEPSRPVPLAAAQEWALVQRPKLSWLYDAWVPCASLPPALLTPRKVDHEFSSASSAMAASGDRAFFARVRDLISEFPTQWYAPSFVRALDDV